MLLGGYPRWPAGSGNNENRARRVIEDSSGNRSEQDRPKAAAVVRAEDDEIGIPVDGPFDEPVRRATVLHLALGLDSGGPALVQEGWTSSTQGLGSQVLVPSATPRPAAEG